MVHATIMTTLYSLGVIVTKFFEETVGALFF